MTQQIDQDFFFVLLCKNAYSMPFSMRQCKQFSGHVLMLTEIPQANIETLDRFNMCIIIQATDSMKHWFSPTLPFFFFWNNIVFIIVSYKSIICFFEYAYMYSTSIKTIFLEYRHNCFNFIKAKINNLSFI